MAGPTVSIVLPAFNRERYLAATIDSVLSQTFPDWELVVVDDGSSDSTPAIIERYHRRFPGKIRPIVQPNAGVAAARNRAITAATDELVAFIDSDDLWPPGKLERQVAAFRAAPGAAFVYTGYEIIDADGRSLETVRPDPRFRGDIYEKLWTEDNRILGPTIMVTREILFRIGLFDHRLPVGENLDLRIKLARLGPVSFVDDTLYRYRRHQGSLSDDRRGGGEQMRRLTDLHLPEPATPKELALRRTALSRYYLGRGNAHFASAEFAQALGWYRRSWPGGRRKPVVGAGGPQEARVPAEERALSPGAARQRPPQTAPAPGPGPGRGRRRVSLRPDLPRLGHVPEQSPARKTVEGARLRIQGSPPPEQVLHETPIVVTRDAEPADRPGREREDPHLHPPLPVVIPLEIAQRHPFGLDRGIHHRARRVHDPLASRQHPQPELGVLTADHLPGPGTDIGSKQAVPLEHFVAVGHVGPVRRLDHRARALELVSHHGRQ